MDTTTSVLGFRLPHPFIAGASPLGFDLDTIKRLEDGGCAAIVIPSLFEEQITLGRTGRIHQRDPHELEWAASLAHFPDIADYALAPDEYAEHIARAKRTVAVPVIASLNGASGESWLTFSRVVEQAGADALELNLYEVVTDLAIQGTAVEHQLTSTVSELKRILTIPIAVKVSPFFAAFGNVARQLDAAGADAVVLFNRFYQPDIDIVTMQPILHAELSTSADLLLRLRWLAILHGRVRPSLVVTGGVATSEDAIKAILAGADGVQMVSALLRHGPMYCTVMREGLERWMGEHHITRLDDGKCEYCKKGMYSHCRFGGWILGNTIDGTQAEYVRIPHADTSLYHIPVESDEEALVMLSDILPTGFECGVLNGQVKPGDTMAIVGAGPIGLAVLLTAQFYAPGSIFMIDLDDNRLRVAQRFGATAVINSADGQAVERVMQLTGGTGVDVAVEAVGTPATFNICQSILAPGGHLANVGVHGKPVELHLEKLWDRNITLTTRLVDTVTTPMLLKIVQSGTLQPAKLVTHRFALADVMKAYDTFGNAAREGALKVILNNQPAD